MTLSTHLLFFLFATLSLSFYIPQVISPNKINSSCPEESRDYVFSFFFNGTLNGRSITQEQYLKCDIAQFPASWYVCRSYCICDCKGIWEPQHPWAAGVTLVWSGNQGRAGVLGTLSRRTQAACAGHRDICGTWAGALLEAFGGNWSFKMMKEKNPLDERWASTETKAHGVSDYSVSWRLELVAMGNHGWVWTL